jgi:N-acetylneuraminic acid mutarotase
MKSGRSSAIVNSFDFNSNRWVSTEAEGPAPNRRYAHSAVEIDGKIFYFGGYASHGYGHVGRWMNDLHTLNVPPLVLESDFPTTNPTSPLKVTWDRIYLVPRPEARAAHSCCALGKDMLLFGGNDGEKLFNDSWMLDTVNMKWKQLITNGTAPSPRSGHSASAIKNRVFIFGGGSYNGSTLNDLYVLDVNTFFWYRPTFDGTAPSPRAGHTSTVIGHKVFIFGGGDRGRVYNDLFLFDTIHMNWSRPTDTGLLPSPRVGHSISTVGQHLLVFGGGDSEGILFNDMYALDTGSIRDSIVVSNDANSEGKKDDRRLSSGSVGDEKREGSGVKSKSWAAVVGGVSDPPPATASHTIHDSVVGERPLDFASQINLITDMIESKIEEQDKEWGQLMDMVLEAHRQGKSDREQIVLELNRLKSLLNS